MGYNMERTGIGHPTGSDIQLYLYRLRGFYPVHRLSVGKYQRVSRTITVCGPSILYSIIAKRGITLMGIAANPFRT